MIGLTVLLYPSEVHDLKMRAGTSKFDPQYPVRCCMWVAEF